MGLRLHWSLLRLFPLLLPAVAHGQLLTNGMPADNVLGQTDFASFAPALTQAGVDHPSGLAYDDVHKRLFVSMGGNQHRILVEGEFGSLRVEVENVPSENPRTGKLSYLSAIAMLREMGAALQVGN